MGRGIVCLGSGGLGKTFQKKGVKTYSRAEIDVNDIIALNSMFEEQRPKYVINCTGIVGTGKCEENPQLAYSVNVIGASNIAYLCNEYGSSMVQISTMYAGDYNVYTKTKWHAERMVEQVANNSWVVRLPWLFGINIKNFILSAVRKDDVKIYTNEKGYLAYDDDVVDYIINNIGMTGLLSIANNGNVTREEILDFIGSDYDFIMRKSNMPNVSDKPSVLLRNWQEPMKELIDGIRSM